MTSSISGTSNTSSNQAVTQAADVVAITSVSDDFNNILKSNLHPDGQNQVSEEELFAALSVERVSSIKGQDAAAKYQKILDTERQALKKPNGFIPEEVAAIRSLKTATAEGVLTASEASAIYNQAFAGAQLDSNKAVLYDSVGGVNDASRAMATLDVAMQSARGALEKMIGGDQTPGTTLIDKAKATGKSFRSSLVDQVLSTLGGTSGVKGQDVTIEGANGKLDGQNGWLFKPLSVNEGKLVMLTPNDLAGGIVSMDLFNSDGKKIDSARLQTAGFAETGRDKWIFSKAGAKYPKDIEIKATLADGSVTTIKIGDPSKRYD